MVRCVPLNAVRLSSLFLKELWVKMSMHRTPALYSQRAEIRWNIYPLPTASLRREGTTLKPILYHCFTQDKITFSTSSHRQKSLHWVPRYGKPHTTFNSTKSLNKAKHSHNATHENYILPTKYTPSHAWKINHNINPSTYQIIHSYNEPNEWHSFKHNITSQSNKYPQTNV